MAAIPPSMPASTANWHWKNKNVTSWAKGWFQRELVTISVKDDNEEEVSISEVVEVDGDVELGQRKSKLITIYDCKVELKWTGKAADGTEVKGKLTIPEVSHEITLDGLSEYEWNFKLTTDSTPAVESVYKLAKSKLPTALETKFSEFPSAIINTHGKDLTVSAEPSRTGTPQPTSTPTPSSSATKSAAASTPKPAVKNEAKAVNTTTVTVESTFMASADDLFSILTDEKRIPAWTRAPAQSAAKPDTEYSLFGGGVKGKYISLTPGKEIVQTWALQSPTWPSGHSATLTTSFEQGPDHTKVAWSLAGAPLGMEDELNKNIQAYYVHGLKSIGYVEIALYHPTPSTAPSAKTAMQVRPRGASATPESTTKQYAALGLAVLALMAAFTIPLVYK